MVFHIFDIISCGIYGTTEAIFNILVKTLCHL